MFDKHEWLRHRLVNDHLGSIARITKKLFVKYLNYSVLIRIFNSLVLSGQLAVALVHNVNDERNFVENLMDSDSILSNRNHLHHNDQSANPFNSF